MTRVDLPCPHGHLEAMWQPVPEPRGLALVCHPHPLFGGTMQNTATFRLARAWNDAGLSALRFNFRGVGGSTGISGPGDGVAELEDAEVAFAWLRAQGPALPTFSSGFSFGSRTALQVAIAHPEVQGAVALGYAASLFDSDFLGQLHTRTAFVHADHDEFATLDAVRALLRRVPAATTLFELRDSDHMATGRLDALSAELARAVAFVLA